MVKASAISRVPIEPNSLPSSPDFARMITLTSCSASARALAAANSSASTFSSSARRASNFSMLKAVAGNALPCGTRKLRP